MFAAQKIDRRECLRKTAVIAASSLMVGGLNSPLFGKDETKSPPTHTDTFALLKKPNGIIPVIYDTDIGGDIDDTWALLYLLKCPELDVRLVSADAGQGIYRAKLAAKYLEACDRSDIPVAISHGGRDGEGNQRDWVADYDLDKYPGKVHDDAVDAIIETIHASDEPVTLICVGAVPNVSAALEKDPSICNNARFVGMHGSIKIGYGGSNTPVPEANVRSDPKALRKVFQAPWNCSVTPLDTCGLLDLKGDRYAKVFSSASRGVAELMKNYRHWLKRVEWLKVKPDPTKLSSTLFDLVAVYMAFSEELLEMETHPLVVDDRGMTLIDQENGEDVRCAMSWKSLAKFQDSLVERLISD